MKEPVDLVTGAAATIAEIKTTNYDASETRLKNARNPNLS